MPVYFIPLNQTRTTLLVVIVIAYTIIATEPQAAWHPALAGESSLWAWWPVFCALCFTGVALATDHFSRTLAVRASLLACGLMTYALALPVFLWLGRVIAHLDRAPVTRAVHGWALMRAYAGYPSVILSMRSSSILFKKPNPNDAEHREAAFLREVSALVRNRAEKLFEQSAESLEQLPARSDQEIRVAGEWLSTSTWHEPQDDGSAWFVVQAWRRGLRDRTVAAAGFALDSGARRTLSDAELREGGFL